jgi:pimeloyl-ACP methyl ester carboxylesterase
MVEYVRSEAIVLDRELSKTYVLVHGAWHGGWCWREVGARLRNMGHRVSTPTQTGVGERKHLMSKDITLSTFTADIINHIEAEELTDIILVGHSFGGTSITGVADKIRDRIRHLIYLDSTILENGQTVFSILPRDVVAARRKLVAEQGHGIFIPAPAPSAFGIPGNHPSADWVKPDAASVERLREPVAHRQSSGKRYTMHLHPLHQPYLPAARSDAAVGEEARKLAVEGNSHRP